MSNNQRFSYAFGAVYLLVGLVGIAVTGGVGRRWRAENPLREGGEGHRRRER